MVTPLHHVRCRGVVCWGAISCVIIVVNDQRLRHHDSLFVKNNKIKERDILYNNRQFIHKAEDRERSIPRIFSYMCGKGSKRRWEASGSG